MTVSQQCIEDSSPQDKLADLTTAQKRRIRRKRLQAARNHTEPSRTTNKEHITENHNTSAVPESILIGCTPDKTANVTNSTIKENNLVEDMSSKETPAQSKGREDVIAAREAKKLAKQKGKAKNDAQNTDKPEATAVKEVKPTNAKPNESISKDEVDKASIKVETITADKKAVLEARAAKKAAKQAKKGAGESDDGINKDLTPKDVVETLKEIVDVAKGVQQVTDKVNAIHLEEKKPEESVKSKAELKAERRAKQEAQRAAKQASMPKVTNPTVVAPTKANEIKAKEEKVSKPRILEKSKTKQQLSNRENCFQQLYSEQEKVPLKNVAINSNLHPAIVKLGVQLATKVVTGSNARCIALLDALKKMLTDYSLPAKTEFARGLESHLASSLDFLWSMRKPSAAQTNAVKYFRHHLTQLPNNVDVLDAKKSLHEEIDRYVREQIDMAGEAISIAVRNKISDGDNILTYGCSSLIERILVEAWSSGLRFHTVVAGQRLTRRAATDMLRRLRANGLTATYVDITALSHVMQHMHKVVLGASALLVNGSVLGAVGSAQVCLAARARNVPVLVAARTHHVSHNVHTDAFVYNEIGDPDELIDKTDENSPLKDWRSNSLLTPLNLMYDVTPPSLVTALVTELAILPCTSAPVVLRFKSEYGI